MNNIVVIPSTNVYRDDKYFLRVKSRVTEAIELDYNKKYPLLLRNESLFTSLIIFFTHEEVYHRGVEITLYIKYERNIG